MEASEDNYRQRLKADPDDFDAQLGLGLLLQSHDRCEEARSCFEYCVQRNPTMLSALFALGTVQHALRDFNAALESFNSIINAVLSGAAQAGTRNLGATYNNLGNVYRDMSRFHDAETCYRQAIRYDPGLAMAFNNLGISLFNGGDIKGAAKAFREAIALDPGFIPAHYHLVQCDVPARRDDQVVTLEKLWDSEDLPAEQRSLLAFTLGRVAEKMGDTANAFRYWNEGNRIQSRLRPYDCAAHLRRLSLIESRFDARVLDDAPCRADTGIVPIFIVGMPRSGSSLVEQILASHPLVHGAGELELLGPLISRSVPGFPDVNGPGREDWIRLGQCYLEELDKFSAGKPYVVNKMLMNYEYIGALRLMLPNARIIHCMRDPLDTCLSCFQHNFTGEGLGFTNRLEDLGQVYCGYRRLLSHWNAILPGWIFQNSYEELVSSPEPSIRKLLSFCGLPYDANCLSFHETRRVVNTASGEQVRRPIYSSSVKNWQKYRHELAELIEILGVDGRDGGGR
jgi:tetratricopeptide (TPR) repeat protein